MCLISPKPRLPQVPTRPQHILWRSSQIDPSVDPSPPPPDSSPQVSIPGCWNSCFKKHELKHWIPWLHFEGDPQIKDAELLPKKSILTGELLELHCDEAKEASQVAGQQGTENIPKPIWHYTYGQSSCYFRCQTDARSSPKVNQCASVNQVLLADDLPPPGIK